MDEQRLDRMEDMLSKLITMVGNLNQQQQEMKNDINEMKTEIIEMKTDIIEMNNQQLIMRNENERQFTGVHKTLTDIRLDQDHIWEKAARNEREFAKLKGYFQL